MNPFSRRPLPLRALAGCLLVVSIHAAAQPPARSDDGLQLIEHDRSGEIYANPDVDWSVYQQIQLLDATVAFRKDWQRDQNRSQPFKVRADDIERIKSSLAALFHKVFSDELTGNGGYSLSATSGDQVLTIKPSIIDLDVYAPDTLRAGGSHQFTESAGRMTLKLELYDSVTGALLARASDRQETPDYDYLRLTTRVTNQAEATRLLQRWARELRRRLDHARGAATGSSVSQE